VPSAEARDTHTSEQEAEALAMLSMGISKAIRVQIVDALIEEPMSPVQFHRKYAPDIPLTTVAYNFRQIAKTGHIKCIKKVRRRGSIEHVYATTALAEYYDNDEWSRIPREERTAMSTQGLRGLFAKSAGALAAGTFDARDDRHLTLIRGRSNEQGWKRAMDILTAAFTALEENRIETERELEQADEEGFRVTYAMLGFESPALPGRANGDGADGGESS
jgi:hypothetical protein